MRKINFSQIIVFMRTIKSSPLSPKASSSPLASTTLSDQAFECLRRDVMMGHFEPGHKLKLDELQAHYGFSNSPLREAMSRLSQDGLIRLDDRKGFRVCEINASDLEDITQMRLLLDIQALKSALSKGDDAWEAGIVSSHYTLEKLEKNMGQGSESLGDTWVLAHKQFHMAILSACHSPRLLQGCASLFDQAERYRQFAAKHRQSPRKKSNEHHTIMQAVLARDSALACRLIEQHLLNTQSHVLSALALISNNQH